VGDTTVGDTTVGDTTVGDTTVGDTTVGETTVGDTTVGDTTVGDTTVAGTTVAGTTSAIALDHSQAQQLASALFLPLSEGSYSRTPQISPLATHSAATSYTIWRTNISPNKNIFSNTGPLRRSFCWTGPRMEASFPMVAQTSVASFVGQIG